ncbi:hypothetical protein NEOKW01_0466 [Nematocida sp. AWRm80]|nr:hypothetical protein NEOKW01_0466 [Nematocida sp. AWRm80]
MEVLNKLSTLIEKAKWAAQVYKEVSIGYQSSIDKFIQATTLPREASWKNDPVIISLLKHCDSEILTLHGLQRISAMVSEEINKAAASASRQISLHNQEESRIQEEVHRYFVLVQKAIDTRNAALKGKYDLWKADLDLKIAISSYLAEESKLRKYKLGTRAQYTKTYKDLMVIYHKTLNEYMSSASGHLNILISEVQEHIDLSGNYSPDLIPSNDSVDQIDASTSAIEKEYQQERFAELYTQATKSIESQQNQYPYPHTLSVKGCGIFYVPKIAKGSFVFLVFTSTRYLHAFAIDTLLSSTSEGALIKKEVPQDHRSKIALYSPRQYSLSNGQDIEEINMYLLDNIQRLPSIKKDFPIAVETRKVSLPGNKREIHIENKQALLFGSKIKIFGETPQQTRKFYLLIHEKPTGTPHSMPESTGTTPRTEVTVPWSSATFDNPW